MGQPGAIFEISSVDSARAREVYGRLFDWEVSTEDSWGGYSLVGPRAGDAAIGEAWARRSPVRRAAGRYAPPVPGPARGPGGPPRVPRRHVGLLARLGPPPGRGGPGSRRGAAGTAGRVSGQQQRPRARGAAGAAVLSLPARPPVR